MVRKVLRRACERRGLDFNKLIPKDSAPKFLHREQEEGIVPHFIESVLDLRRSGQKKQALKTALACSQLHPYDPYYYKPVAYLLAPLSLISYYRSRKTRYRYSTGRFE